MLPAIFPILNRPSIQHYVGAEPARIFDFGMALEDTEPPYIVFTQVVDQPYEHLSGVPTADFSTVQIDCYCIERIESRGLALAIRNAFDQAGLSNRLVIQTQESDTKLFRIGFEVDLIDGR